MSRWSSRPAALAVALSTTVALARAAALTGCGGGPSSEPEDVVETGGGETPPQSASRPRDETPPPQSASRPRVEAPPSGPARDVHLPPIARTQLANGLEINTVRAGTLPVVYVQLVIRSGLASDPPDLPGLSLLVANMLKEGTRRRTSAELAEAIEHLGADLSITNNQESIAIQIRALAEHLDTAMGLIAEMAITPRFDEQELRRLRQRELDRLRIVYADPSQLARREFYRAIYAGHPYRHVDATAEGLQRARRQDLVAWHRDRFVPNNAFLVVAGDVTPERVRASAERAFGRWRPREVAPVQFPELPARSSRDVIVVHRPSSEQSVIAIGNLAIPRNHPDWVPLAVANQVLGGSAASRLFMDLRERRSLTYGAYSGIDELPHIAPFRARAAVGRDPRQPDVDRTAAAMEAFLEHLERIVREQPSAEEVDAARRFLADSFPLQIEHAGRIAQMVSDLRLYGLADDYWDTYRSEIRSVTPEAVLAAARAHIHPESALIVVVADAEAVAQPLRRWGPVRVIHSSGEEIARFPAAERTPE
jgi:zinc protease